MSGHVQIFKVKDKSNKIISFHINDEKLLVKYKIIWSKIERLKNIELNALSVYDDEYMKNKRRPYTDKVYTNSRRVNVLEYNIECKSFTAMFFILYFYPKIILLRQL